MFTINLDDKMFDLIPHDMFGMVHKYDNILCSIDVKWAKTISVEFILNTYLCSFLNWKTLYSQFEIYIYKYLTSKHKYDLKYISISKYQFFISEIIWNRVIKQNKSNRNATRYKCRKKWFIFIKSFDIVLDEVFVSLWRL